MAQDGSIIIDVDLNTEEIQGELKKMNAAIEKGFETIKKMAKETQEACVKMASGILKSMKGLQNALKPVSSETDKVSYGFKKMKENIEKIETMSKVGKILDSLATAWSNAKFSAEGYAAALRIGNDVASVYMSGMKGFDVLVGILTGNIKLAAGAQTLWNTAIKANQIGLLISAVKVAADLITPLLDSMFTMSDEQQRHIEAAKKEIEKANELCEASRNLNDSIKSGQKSREEAVKNTEAEAYATKKLADKLFELADKENKTNSEKKTMQGLVDRLNNTMPNLGLKFDIETGKLEANRKEVYKSIEARKELAKQNAQMDVLEELYRDNYRAQLNYSSLESKKKDVEQKLSKQKPIIDSAQKSVKYVIDLVVTGDSEKLLYKTNEDAKELKDSLDEIDIELKNTDKTIETTSLNINECLNRMTQSAVINADKIKNGFSGCAQNFSTDVEGMRQAAQTFGDEMNQNGSEYGSDFIAAWNKAVTQAPDEAFEDIDTFISYVLEAMAKEDKAGEQGDKNAKSYSKSFTDSITNESDNMEAAAKDSIDEVGQEGDLAAQENGKKVGQTYGSAVSSGAAENTPDLSTPVNQGLGDAKQTAGAVGTEVGAAAVGGVEKKASEESSAVGNALNKVIQDAMIMTKPYAGSEGFLVGQALLAGMEFGITSNSQKLNDAITKAVRNAVEAGRQEAEVNSPSRVTYSEIGEPLVEGIALGIKENAGEISEEFKKALNDLALQRDIGVLDEAEYYKRLEELRDEYLKEGTDEWWKHTKSIISFEQKGAETELDLLKKKYSNGEMTTEEYYAAMIRLRDEYFTEGTAAWAAFDQKITDLNAEALAQQEKDLQKQVEEAQKKFDSLADKARATFGMMDKTVFKNIGPNGEDETYYDLHDYSADAEATRKYNDLLKQVEERGAEALGGDASLFFEELLNLSEENGSALMAALMEASDEAFLDYIEGWKKELRESERTAALKMQITNEIIDPGSVSAAFDGVNGVAEEKTEEICTTIAAKLKEKGMEIPQDFFASGAESAVQFGNGFADGIGAAMGTVRERLQEEFAKIREFVYKNAYAMTPVSVAMAGVPAGGAAVSSTSYTNTFNISPAKDRTVDQIAAWKAVTQVERMRGGY